MDNKGQSLVLFVLFLPLLFLLIAIIYDLGTLEINKQKNINEIKSVITYGLKHTSDANLNEKLKNLLDENIKAAKTITIENSQITINIKYDEKSIFPSIIKDSYPVDITYKGYLDNNTVIIEKE